MRVSAYCSQQNAPGKPAGAERMTRGYQGPAWPCLISAVCPKQSEGSSDHWTSRWFSALFTLYATNWFAPRILYQWINGQEWCIRSPAQKLTLVKLAGAWSTSCLNTDGPSEMGMWLCLLWLSTHGPLATMWTYPRLKLSTANPLWPHGVS